MAYRILIADKLAEKAAAILQKAGHAVDTKLGLSEADLAAIIPGYHAMLVRSAVKVTKTIIDASSDLKVIGRAGTGVDNIDVAAATAKGILVMNVPGGNTVTAAEHTLALMFALARNIPQGDASLRAGQWERSRFTGRELTGKTLGLIGFGRIGRAVADRAMGLKMRVVAYDPLVPSFEMDGAGVKAVETLDELLGVADVISVHTPMLASTRGILNRETLAKTKKGVMIINCARGGVVDEAALVEALASGQVSGAALDVFEKEPPVGSPLLTLPNVVLTPHLGASTKEAQTRVAIAIAEQVRDFLESGRKTGAVN